MPEQNATASAPVDQVREFVAAVAASIVDDPGRVRVEAEKFDDETELRLLVSPDDLGRLIGKGGRTARSLRTIVHAVGSKVNERFSLDIESDED